MKRNKICIETGIIRIIDSLFNKDWWASHIFNECEKGTWYFNIRTKNGYPKFLKLYHRKYKLNKKKLYFCKYTFLIIISNKISIFDEKYYAKQQELIFDKCFALYKNGIHLYLIRNKCDIFIQRNKSKKIVAFYLDF